MNKINKVFENIYYLILKPDLALEMISNNLSISYSLLLVLFVSIFSHTLNFSFNCSILNNTFIFFCSLIFSIFITFFLWIMECSTFALMSKIFTNNSKFLKLLCLSSYSFLPFILISPVDLLKELGAIGYFFSVIFQLFIYLWVIFLFLKTIQFTYKISLSRALILFIIPFICLFFVSLQVIDFIFKVSYIFTV